MDAGGRVLGRGHADCLDIERSGGEMVHDPAGWVAEMTAAARVALADAGASSVDAIAIGALGPAPVLLDRDLQPLAPSPISSMGPVGPRIAAWRRERPELFEKVAWVVDVTGFLVSTLVGRPVMDAITADDHVTIGDPIASPPTPQEALTMAGGLTRDAAGWLGLGVGTPVTVGTYDTFVDLAGIGVLQRGDAGLVLGSTLNIGVICESAEASEGLRASRHVGSGWFVGGWTSAAGRALDWCLGLFPEAERAGIEKAAGQLMPGAGGLLSFPHLDGERAPVWDPLARGAVLGLTTATTPEQIYRSMVDSVALAAADLARRMRGRRIVDRPWRVTGGGVRNDTWLRATADAIGEPLEVLDLPGAGAAARFALRALGADVPPLESRIVEPDAERHVRAGELLDIGDGLYAGLAEHMHRLGAMDRRASEQAPGIRT